MEFGKRIGLSSLGMEEAEYQKIKVIRNYATSSVMLVSSMNYYQYTKDYTSTYLNK